MRFKAKLRLVGDLLCAWSAKRRGGDPSRVLAIRLDGFGDFALYLPYALALREVYPRGKFHLALLANSAWCDLARELLDFDEYIPLDVSGFMSDFPYRAAMNRRIASGGFGTVLQPRFFREPLLEDRLALAAGASRGTAFAVGAEHQLSALGRRLEVALYDCLPAAEAMDHELKKNRWFFDATGVWREVERPVLPPAPSGWLPGRYLVVLPGSGKGVRGCYPAERWGLVCAGVNLPVAVAGAPDESVLTDAAAKSIGATATPLAGKLGIVDFAGLLAHAGCVVGNDTGGIHFAAWCGVPALAVAGGGHPGCYYPYPPEFVPSYVRAPRYIQSEKNCFGCGWRCRFDGTGAYPCLEEIKPESVSDALQNLLRQVAHP